jgi:hypothetical protein
MTDMFLIWSHKHEGWWGPNRAGYFADLTRAGWYTEAEADKIVNGMNWLDDGRPVSVKVPLPNGDINLINSFRILTDTLTHVTRFATEEAQERRCDRCTRQPDDGNPYKCNCVAYCGSWKCPHPHPVRI